MMECNVLSRTFVFIELFLGLFNPAYLLFPFVLVFTTPTSFASSPIHIHRATGNYWSHHARALSHQRLSVPFCCESRRSRPNVRKFLTALKQTVVIIESSPCRSACFRTRNLKMSI